MVQLVMERLRWVFLSVMIGLFAGLSAACFLFLLDGVTDFRVSHPELIWGLPLGGLISGFIYWRYGKQASGGNALIIDAVHDPKKVVPLRMAPLILISTVLTHLFGGSAGREGAAVQMSASLSVQLSRWFDIRPEEKRILLMAGMGAGFGATVGAPWAGFVFGLEVIRLPQRRLFAALECWVASFVGYGVTRVIHVPHPHLPKLIIPQFLPWTVFGVILAGVAFGFLARVFVFLSHGLQTRLRAFPIFPPLIPAVLGAVLAALYFLTDSLKYGGLGLSVIEQALSSRTPVFDPFYKLGFTVLTVGGGFKGGEYVPLVFMGSTLGNALGQWLALSPPFFAALGYVAVFGGASKTPFACACLGMELFGFWLGPYALLACWISYKIAGDHGIYHSPRRRSSHS